MSFHLTHKQTALIRNLDYRSRRRKGDEEEFLVRESEDFRVGEDVGFRVWGDQETGRTVLLINCQEDWTALKGGFGRLMDIFQNDVAQELRPSRIFVVSSLHGIGWMLYELSFKRDGDIYMLVDFGPVTLRGFRELLQDESIQASYTDQSDS